MNGLIPMLPTKTPITTAPALTGLHPNTSWNSSVSRNGIAPTTSQKKMFPAIALPSVGMRSTRRFTSGAGVRSRCHAAAVSRTAAATPRTITSVHDGEGSAMTCAL